MQTSGQDEPGTPVPVTAVTGTRRAARLAMAAEPLTERTTGPVHAPERAPAFPARAAAYGRSLLRGPIDPGPRDVRSRWQGKREWLVPAGIVAVAAAARLIGLDHPPTLVFDETYYVKDGWSILQLGYEASWPDGANEAFESGDTNSFLTDGTRVVHPPLGKWIIGLGMLAFGGDSSFGWRVSGAVLGVLTVLLTYLISRRMTGSVIWAGLAGLFVAIDGMSIVMSRVSLLDGILTFFVVLGVLCIVYDHRGAMARIARSDDAIAGPVLWDRPWIIAAGAAFGAASAVKWSGLFVLAGFGIYLVVSDALARRRAGVRMWGSSAIGRQAPVSFLLLVPVAGIVYVASWTGWLISANAYGRDADDNPFVALWNYHSSSLGFHVGLNSGHQYESPAWQWPFLIRPTAMYWTDGIGADGVQTITGIPNPLLWWLGWAAAISLVALFVAVRDWRIAIVLTALATTYLPWLAVPERTIFAFYTVLLVPFLMLALVLLLQHVTGAPEAAAPRVQRGWRIGIAIMVALAVAVSLFFLPLWTGMTIPYDYWRMHMWLPTWI